MNLPKAAPCRSLSVMAALVVCVHMHDQAYAQTPTTSAPFMLQVDAYSDRAANNRAYENRQYNNRQYFNRQYENRQYENRRYNNQLYQNEQDQKRHNEMASP